jgi:hypothetical protein
LTKPNFKGSLNILIPASDKRLDNFTEKAVWFSYPYLNDKGKSVYFHSLGIGLEYQFFPYPKVGFSVFLNYYYRIKPKQNNFESLNKFTMIEAGIEYIFNPYKAQK